MAEADRDENIARGCLTTFVVGIVAIFVLFAMTNSGTSNSGSRQSSDSVVWNVYDVTLDIGADGVIHVTERQEVRFDGVFSQGYAVIPMDRIESIDNVRITVEGAPQDLNNNKLLDRDEATRPGPMLTATQVYDRSPFNKLDPNTFHVQEGENDFRIDYGFEPTGGGVVYTGGYPQVRTVVLEYDVTGVIRDYPEAEEPWQQVHWMAISSEVTDIARVREATVTINLPEAVPVEDLAYAPEPQTVEGSHLVWTRENMGEGDFFDAQVAFPAITSATAPAWQPEADARDASIEERENRQSLAGLLLIGAGILTVVGGGLGILYAWFTRVREVVPGVVPDQLYEPPDDLPAGLVGALVDEEVNPRDIAATILDLHHREIVRISEVQAGDERPRFARPEREIELLRPLSYADPFEQEILRVIFGDRPERGVTQPFSALRALFGSQRHRIQHAIDEELVERGYLEELPETSRERWTWLLKGIVGFTFLVSIGLLLWLQVWTWWAVIPPVAGIAIYYAGKRLTPSIARKTPKGAEVAARWKAFENFLRSDHRGLFSKEWEKINARYLPWAVAFGMDHRWLSAMNAPFVSSAGAAASTSRPSTSSSRPSGTFGSGRSWGEYDTRSRGGGSTGRTRWSPTVPSWGWDASQWSDMQGASDSVFSKLSAGSESMFEMMGDAMAAIGEHSKNSGGGGGWSGGGGFGGSSSSGGGRSSSSSGGGSRGFS